MLQNGVRHTFWAGPWHYCGVCDKKTKIAVMRWQRGVIKCPQCFDAPPLKGQREVAIAAVLEDGKEELVPVEKLRNPTPTDSADDIIL